METEGSLLCWQGPPVVPFPSQINPVHTIQPDTVYLRSILMLFTHLRLGLYSGLFPSGFPTNLLYVFFSPIRATRPRVNDIYSATTS
jgi:hypothetical protein